MRVDQKNKLLQLRRWRTRKRVIGSQERPRMSVRFTSRNIHVQFINDAAGKTLAFASTVTKTVRESGKTGSNVITARKLGTIAAEAAKAVGITAVVFDRSGSRFHGKVKALADAAREAGLQF